MGHIVRRGKITTEWSDEGQGVSHGIFELDFAVEPELLVMCLCRMPFCDGPVQVALQPNEIWHAACSTRQDLVEQLFQNPVLRPAMSLLILRRCHNGRTRRRSRQATKNFMFFHQTERGHVLESLDEGDGKTLRCLS